MKAAILCPGPSLRDTIPKNWVWKKKPRFDKVVAVTDAIFADAPIDAWAYQEGPQHKHQGRYQRYGARVMEIEPEMWVIRGSGENWINKWTLPKEWVKDDLYVSDMVDAFPWKAEAWLVGKRKRRGKIGVHKPNEVIREYGCTSAFYAIARCIHMGCTGIHIYGCDMEGQANFSPKDGSPWCPKRGPKWWNERWSYERPMMKDVISEARKNGVEIVRHTKKISVPEAPEAKVDMTDGWL